MSYLDPSIIPTRCRSPPLDPGGSWQCVWGPAQDSDESNLVFVAAYSMSAGMPPTFAAVVTRGTDVDVNDFWGILKQIWEDLDVTSQVSIPWEPNNPALIASGTVDGLNDIQSLLSGGVTLLEFLVRYLSAPANANPVLVVTGHSLGGCLTSVVAPWLKSALAGQLSNFIPIVPATFAAPTAGDANFASYFQSSFSYALRVANSLDVAPSAWRTSTSSTTSTRPATSRCRTSCTPPRPDGTT